MSKSPNPESVFTRFELDSDSLDWSSHLFDLTPVHRVGNLTFKREDAFAPLGYGGINGAKLRQLIHLVSRYRQGGGKAGLLTGASVLSPQLPMAAAVASHFGLPSLLVLGSTSPETAIRRDMVKMAAWFGAKFDFSCRVAYNPVLQNQCRKLHEGKLRDHFYLEYGITLDHAIHEGRDVLAFHDVGARQVDNIPEDVTDLVLPAGSCNSCTSILHGLVRSPKPNLKNIHLVGIGPSKLDLVNARLRIFEELTDVRYAGAFDCQFEGKYDTLNPDRDLFQTREPLYKLHYDDLHARGIVRYEDPQPYSYEGIDFHPTYEGKVMNWLFKYRPELVKPSTLFWVIGSKPSIETMAPLLQRRNGPCPERALEMSA